MPTLAVTRTRSAGGPRWYASNGINPEGLRSRPTHGTGPIMAMTATRPAGGGPSRYASNGINLEGLRFRATRGSAPSRRARGAGGAAGSAGRIQAVLEDRL